MEPVRGHRKQKVVEAARLQRAKVRREQNRTLLEGPALVRDAIAAGCQVHSLFALQDDQVSEDTAKTHSVELHTVDERALRRIAGTNSPRGPVAVVEIPEERLDPNRDILVSWAVSDPGNVGTLIRTAAAFGWSYGYVAGSADPWAPKTLRAGAAGQFQTAVKQIAGLSDLIDWTTVATVVEGGSHPHDVTDSRIAVLIGEEGQGLPAEVADACAARVTILTPGPTESLNAAVAAGIVLHQMSNRWGQPEPAM